LGWNVAIIYGTSGNDSLSGTESYDQIYGLAGDDQLFGGGGDDALEGGAGNDILDGGAGTDTARYDITPGTVTFNMATGTVTGATSGNDTLISIEQIQTSGAGRTVFIGRDNVSNYVIAFSTGANVLSGGNGDDFIFDAGVGSTLDGGGGTDSLTLARYGNTPFVQTFKSGVSGTLADGTTYSNFEIFSLQTGGGDDSVTFVSPVSNKIGDPINHSYWQAFGGYDTATIDLSSYSAPYMTYQTPTGSVYLIDQSAPGSKNVMGFDGVDKFVIIGGSGNDVFNGSTGNEVYTGGGGNDLLNGGSDFDIARYSGLSSDYRIDAISEQSFRITDLRSGSPDGTDTLIKIEQLQWGDASTTTLLNTAPVLVTSDRTAAAGQTLALSSLFTVSDHEGDPIVKYQIWDSIDDPNSGYFTINGAPVAAKTVVEITAAQLSQTNFVAGQVADNLQIRAFDGHGWSSLSNESWSPFTVAPAFNHAPAVFGYDFQRAQRQTIAITDLLTTFDSDGDTITRYQFWDSTRDAKSGHFVFNGAIQAAGTVIDVTAAQLAQISFVTGTINDDLQVRVFDGKTWSAADNEPWSPFTVILPANRAPDITTSNLTKAHTQTLSVSSLMLTHDPDGDPMVRYQLWDSTLDPNSGYFVVGGVVQAAGKIIDVTAAQLGQTSFVTGTVGDTLQIRASDGINWSAADNASWSPFTITVPANHAPVVTTAPIQQYHYLSVGGINALANITDPDGDPITLYQLWDGTSDPNSGHFVVNGTAMPAKTVITVTPAQLGQVSFVTGIVNDDIQIRAFDGAAWSAADNAAWAPFTVLVPAYTVPVVTTANLAKTQGQSLWLPDLFAVDDADSDGWPQLQLWDSTRDPNSGHWLVNGVVQAAGTVIDINNTTFQQTYFVTGSVNDDLQIRVFDGTSWSAADNAAWAPFTVGPTAHVLPVVQSTNVTQAHGQSLALSTLIQATGANGAAITRYQIRDPNPDPASGYVTINGAIQPAGSVIDMTAAQFAQASFVTGSPSQAKGNIADSLQVRAFDGTDWSAADNAQWTPITVITASNTPPTLQLTGTIGGGTNNPIALSDMLSFLHLTDVDHDSMTKVQLWDSTVNPFSGYWAINGVAQSASRVIEVDASQFAQVTYVTGQLSDNLQMRAFDGIDWSAADNAPWAPFTFVVQNTAPDVVTSDVNAQHGRTLALSSLIAATDDDGYPVIRYQLWDSSRDPNSGHFIINGVAQAAGTVIDITPAQFAQASFVTGKVSDSLQVRAFDGVDWSAADNVSWSPFNVNVTSYTAPTLNTADKNTTANQTFTLSSLFSVNDPDGDTMTRYQLWDSTADPNSGHFVVGGAAKAASTVIDITAAQLGQTSFVTGTAGDSLQIRAFDGISWTAADNAAWAPFHINVS
jgi:Ca2+-binding RTX toxin-like protein